MRIIILVFIFCLVGVVFADPVNNQIKITPPIDGMFQLYPESWISFNGDNPNVYTDWRDKGFPYLERKKLLDLNLEYGIVRGDMITFINPHFRQGKKEEIPVPQAKTLPENQRPLRYKQIIPQMIKVKRNRNAYKYIDIDVNNLDRISRTLIIALQRNFMLLRGMLNPNKNNLFVINAVTIPYRLQYHIYMEECIKEESARIDQLDFWGLPKTLYAFENRGEKPIIAYKIKVKNIGANNLVAGEIDIAKPREAIICFKKKVYGFGFPNNKELKVNIDQIITKEPSPFIVVKGKELKIGAAVPNVINVIKKRLKLTQQDTIRRVPNAKLVYTNSMGVRTFDVYEVLRNGNEKKKEYKFLLVHRRLKNENDTEGVEIHLEGLKVKYKGDLQEGPFFPVTDPDQYKTNPHNAIWFRMESEDKFSIFKIREYFRGLEYYSFEWRKGEMGDTQLLFDEGNKGFTEEVKPISMNNLLDKDVTNWSRGKKIRELMEKFPKNDKKFFIDSYEIDETDTENSNKKYSSYDFVLGNRTNRALTVDKIVIYVRKKHKRMGGADYGDKRRIWHVIFPFERGLYAFKANNSLLIPRGKKVKIKLRFSVYNHDRQRFTAISEKGSIDVFIMFLTKGGLRANASKAYEGFQ